MLKDAPLCVAGGLQCVPLVARAVDAARLAGVPVVWVCREHHPSGVDVEASRKHLFELGRPGVCVSGTRGAALVEPLAARPGELYVVKKRWSAFFGTPLDVALRRMGVSRVVVAGVQTPNCIRHTAMDAVSLDYEAVVLRDATASATTEVQEANCADMERAGVSLLSVDLWAMTLALKAFTPGSLVATAGEGLTQGLNLAGAGVFAVADGIGAGIGGIGQFFGGGGGGSGNGGGENAAAGGGAQLFSPLRGSPIPAFTPESKGKSSPRADGTRSAGGGDEGRSSGEAKAKVTRSNSTASTVAPGGSGRPPTPTGK